LVLTNSVLPRLDVANDRQLYLASIGPFFALGVGVEHSMDRIDGRVPLACLMALVVCLAIVTVQRNQAYESEVALWEATAAQSPNKPRVANSLGYACQRSGQTDKARSAYLRALHLDPEYWRARINLDTLETPSQR